jgi:hypothetical protein
MKLLLPESGSACLHVSLHCAGVEDMYLSEVAFWRSPVLMVIFLFDVFVWCALCFFCLRLPPDICHCALPNHVILQCWTAGTYTWPLENS